MKIVGTIGCLLISILFLFGCVPATTYKQPDKHRIYNEKYEHKGFIENGRIYDKNWKLKGHIDNGRIYDENWKLKGYIERKGGK